MCHQCTTSTVPNKTEPDLSIDFCGPLTSADVELACRWIQLADDMRQLVKDTEKEHHGRCDGCTLCINAAHGSYLLEAILGVVEGSVSWDLRTRPWEAKKQAQSPEERSDGALYLRALTALHEAQIATETVGAAHEHCPGCDLCRDAGAVGHTVRVFAECLRSTAPGWVLGELLRAGMMEAPPEYLVAIGR